MASGYHAFGTVYVDGVEMRISEKLKPPPRVSLPLNFDYGNPTEVLFMEYDFKLEEKMVVWCDKQKEIAAQRQKALEEAAKEAVKLAEEREANRKLMEAKAAEKAAKVKEENDKAKKTETPKAKVSPKTVKRSQQVSKSSDKTVESDKSNQVQCTAAQVPHQPITSNINSTANYNQPIFYSSAAGGILTPLPAQVSTSNQPTAVIKPKTFDPKDFENTAQDPFEAVELKTLDDMAELNKVLSGAQISVKSDQANTAAKQATGMDANSSVASVYAASTAPYVFTQDTAPSTAHAGYPSQVINQQRMPFTTTGIPIQQNSQAQQMVYRPPTFPGNIPVGQTPDFNIVQHSLPSVALPYQQTQPQRMPSIKDVGYPEINLGSAYQNQPSTAAGSFNTNFASTSFQPQKQADNTTTANNSSYNPWPTTTGYINAYANTASYSKNGGGFSGQRLQHISSSSLPALVSQQNSTPSANNPMPNTYGGLVPSTYNNATQQTQTAVTNPFNNRQLTRQGQQTVPQSQGQNMTHSGHMITQGNQMNIQNQTGQLTQRSPGQPMVQQGYVQQVSQQNHSAQSSGRQNDYQNSSPENFHQSQSFASGTGSRSQNHSRTCTPEPEVPQMRSAKSASDLASLNSDSEFEFQTTNINGSISRTSNISRESHTMIERITSKNFPRQRVEYAVQNIGSDEKKVVEYLCSANRLANKGFNEEDVDIVLLTLRYEESKALKHLELLKIFKEFGFPDAKIHEGLIKNKGDEERTLDWLTSQ